ncbi:MAG: DUF929 family protein [Candidatus Micrarchaeaceae archaeon]
MYDLNEKAEKDGKDGKEGKAGATHGNANKYKLLLIVIVVIAAIIVAAAILSSLKPKSSLSPSINAKASGAFFLGPDGSPMNASFMSIISNLSAQLEVVGEEQLSGTFIHVNATSSQPGFYVLLFGNASVQNYDLVPIPVSPSIAPLTSNNTLMFVFISAQGCPYCAGMRWPVAIALSRFGNFSKLFYDRSATNDGNVPTFMFNFSEAEFNSATKNPPVSNGEAPYGDEYPTPISTGSYYSSKYITLEPFDEMGSSFFFNDTGLEALSPLVYSNVYLEANKQVNGTYSGFGIKGFSMGGVPFFSIGNKYVFDGAIINASTYLSQTGLEIYNTHASMLYSIENPKPGSFGQTALGAANLLTADICLSINNTAPVCSLPYIKQLEAKLSALNYSGEYS